MSVEVARVVAAQLSVDVAKLLVEHTISRTVSFVGSVSGSEEVAVKVTVAPGSAGELSQNAVKVGLLFTLKGDDVVPVPCRYAELQRGLTATASHTHATQIFSSSNGATSVVVVAAVACAALAVKADTAHCVAPAPHVGAAPALAVGVVEALQISK